MILARAPLRLSLAGGGTDLEAYYARYGGMVVSTTIDKYFYVFLSPGGSEGVQISSSDYRRFYRQREEETWDDDLGLVRAILREWKVTNGVCLFLASEIPPGTGLGSSSTVAVALAKALATYQRRNMGPAKIAEFASTIEIERLGSPIGRQDQYAAAYGGFNAITFHADGITVEPLSLAPEARVQLEENLLLFFTGSSRSANSILSEQREASQDDESETVSALHVIKQMAVDTRNYLERGQIREFGKLLDASWQEKKRLAPGITNPRIDELYDLAKHSGALGGKIAGAGGGGFLMVYAEPQHQGKVTEVLEEQGLFRLDYHFESAGAIVLLNTQVGGWPIQDGYIGATA